MALRHVNLVITKLTLKKSEKHVGDPLCDGKVLGDYYVYFWMTRPIFGYENDDVCRTTQFNLFFQSLAPLAGPAPDRPLLPSLTGS